MSEQIKELDEKVSEEILSPSKLVWRRFKRNKLAIVGAAILLALILFVTVGPLLSPYDQFKDDLINADQAPTQEHILGTDNVGRDVMTRLMYAGRISLTVGIASIAISIFIGVIMGTLAGYYGGIVDSIIMRVVDILMCVPSLALLILLSALMSDLKIHPDYRIYIIMFIIGITGWMGIARLIRGQILSLREQEFMQATEALGLRTKKKMFRHLLPNLMAIIIVQATLGLGGAIMYESTLSFLGLGITPPRPSWGTMVQRVTDSYAMEFLPWTWVPAGICIFLAVMAINLLGDGLRDALDPKLKR